MSGPVTLQIYPSLILGVETQQVEVFDSDLYWQAQQLISLMYLQNGKGLAANQAGLNISMCVIEFDEKLPPKVLVNPVWTGNDEASLPTIDSEEGCLSFPGLKVKVKRAPRYTVRYQDLTGVTLVETFLGMDACVVAHELDHLRGFTFLDRLGPVMKDIQTRKWNKLQKRVRQYNQMMGRM